MAYTDFDSLDTEIFDFKQHVMETGLRVIYAESTVSPEFVACNFADDIEMSEDMFSSFCDKLIMRYSIPECVSYDMFRKVFKDELEASYREFLREVQNMHDEWLKEDDDKAEHEGGLEPRGFEGDEMGHPAMGASDGARHDETATSGDERRVCKPYLQHRAQGFHAEPGNMREAGESA